MTGPRERPTGRLIVPRSDLDVLLARASALADAPGRRMLGVTGSPGAGKSTLAAAIVGALGGRATLLPMDGFHLAQRELARLGREETKGAIDTFDVGGFVHLLERVRKATEPVVYAPVFRRDLEEPIAGAIAVPADIGLIVVEGDYLLADDGQWQHVREYLDECWFVDPGESARLEWLIDRHREFGRDHQQAADRAGGSDQINAELVAATRHRADVLIVGA